MKKIKRGLLFSFALAAVTFMSIPEGKDIANGISARNQLLRLAPTETERQYIGYGYDVTGGVAICDTDALMLNNPILDVDSDELLPLMKSFDASQTTYISNTTASASEISESYGIALSGGVRGSVSAINLNVSTSFNTNIGWSKSSTKTEEYSYHTILAKNKTVVLQANTKQLRDHLNPRFLADALAVKNVEDAKQLIKTYGTHLLTGYTLGGLFELTNYFATDSSSYVRELSVGFDSQVGATISAMNVQTDFSFAMNYGLKDNNSHAVNNYKCTTFGGLSFPGLTIDQAFKYYETAFGAGYIYQIWTDSINEGKNLVICDIPQSSKMIPIWEILPVSSDFDKIKTEIINAYMALAADGLTNHRSNYPDIVNSITLPELENPSFRLNGFNYFAGSNEGAYSRYVAVQDQKTPEVLKDYILALDYNEGAFKGLDINWEASPAASVEILDSHTGIFKVLANEGIFRVDAFSSGTKIFSKNFEIVNKDYSSGSGTKNDPYIISNPYQFLKYSLHPEDWNAYVELGADIDFSEISHDELENTFKPIGNDTNGFRGHFDGVHHYIKNLNLSESYFDLYGVPNFGLFGTISEGTIINLNIDKCSFLYSYSGDLKETNASAVKSIGLLAGLCKSGTVIENCIISNSQINYDASSLSAIDGGSLDLYGGLVAGRIAGSQFRHVHIKSCELSISAKSGTSNTYAGGLVGLASEQKSEFYVCSSDNTSITAGSSNLSSARHNHAGGLIGRTTEISMEDILVTRPKVSVLIGGKATYSYYAFIIGDLSNDVLCSFNRMIVANTSSDSITYVSGKSGRIFGDAHSVGSSKLSAKDIASEITNDDMKDIATVSSSSATNIGTAIMNLRWYNGTPSAIIESQYWEADAEGYPSIKITKINAGLFEFDFSEVKTEFVLGEKFKTGNIKITGYDDDGNSFDVNSYYVNYNAFDSGSIGTYAITVSTNGASSSYDVVVKEAVRASIRAKLKHSDEDFYQYECVNKDCFNVYSVDEKGNETPMDSEEFTISTSKTLNKGDNLVSISTLDGKFTTQLVVNAKPRKVKRLQWEDAKGNPTIEPVVEAVYGSRDISLKGKSFGVIFDDGGKLSMNFMTDKLLCVEFKHESGSSGSYELDANIVDLVIPSIKYGLDNTGYLCYGDYDVKPLTFKINGLGAPTDDEIKAFISKVDAVYDSDHGISSKLTLEQAHRLILEANELLESFGDYRDDNINGAIDKLNEAINAYNYIAEGINGEVEQGIFIISSFNYELLAKSGVISFSLIVAIILLVF